MEEYFTAFPITNSNALCVGEITNAEADLAKAEGIPIDGFGYYLFLADQSDPQRPIEVLAKFASSGAAERVARLMRASGRSLSA